MKKLFIGTSLMFCLSAPSLYSHCGSCGVGDSEKASKVHVKKHHGKKSAPVVKKVSPCKKRALVAKNQKRSRAVVALEEMNRDLERVIKNLKTSTKKIEPELIEVGKRIKSELTELEEKIREISQDNKNDASKAQANSNCS